MSGQDRQTGRLWRALALIVILGAFAIPISFKIRAQHTQTVTALAWSPDGTALASVTTNSIVSLWDTHGHLIGHFQSQQTGVNTLLWSPDARYVLTLAADGTAFLWTKDGKPFGIFQWCISPFCDWQSTQNIQWSPTSEYLAVSPESGPLQVWRVVPDTNSGAAVALLAGISMQDSGADVKMTLAWSPDGSMLAAGHRHEATTYIWDLSSIAPWLGVTPKGIEGTGALKATLNGPEQSADAYVKRLEWSPDGNTLAIGYLGWTLQLWSPDGGLKTVSSYSTDISGQYDNVELAWSPDGQFLAAGDRYDDSGVKVNIWSRSGQLIEAIPHSDAVVIGLAWSKQRALAVAYNSDPALTIWNQNEKVRRLAVTFNPNDVLWIAPAWSFDGTYVSAFYTMADESHQMQVWKADGTPVTTMTSTADNELRYAWSPISNILAVSAPGGNVHIINVANLKS